MGLEIDCRVAYVNCAATPNHECCGGDGSVSEGDFSYYGPGAWHVYCGDIDEDAHKDAKCANKCGVKHCDLAKAPPRPRKNMKTWNVGRDKSKKRRMLAGPGKGKKCSDATEGDILACVKVAQSWGREDVESNDDYSVMGNNCQHKTAQALSECCLKTDWGVVTALNLRGGKGRRCLKWAVVTTYFPPTTVMVCQEWTPDYNY